MLLYPVYFLLVAAAVFRTWPSASVRTNRREREVVAILMAILPVGVAVGLTTALLSDNAWAPGLFGVFFGGLIVLAVGIFFRKRLPGRSALAWRLLGWAVAASVLLIPASTVLLAWIPGLLAFLIPWPEGWLGRQSHGRHPLPSRGQGCSPAPTGALLPLDSLGCGGTPGLCS